MGYCVARDEYVDTRKELAGRGPKHFSFCELNCPITPWACELAIAYPYFQLAP
jgi:hypothetical protein